MKIKRLRIQNFKSIIDETLEDFTKINMLYGHNNSGKSNILKFIELLFSPKVDEGGATGIDSSRISGDIKTPPKQVTPFWSGIIENQPFIFRNNDWKKPIIFEIDLVFNTSEFSSLAKGHEEVAKVYLTKETFELKLKGKIVGDNPYTSTISLTSVFIDDKDIYSKSDDNKEEYFNSSPEKSPLRENGFDALSAILDELSSSVLLLDNDRYFKSEKENSSISELTPENFKNWLHNSSLQNERYEEFKRIVSEISRYAPDGATEFKNCEKNSPLRSLSIEFSRENTSIGIMLKNAIERRLPLESFGTGMHQVFYILAKIAEKKPKIVLIEEMELNLSPKYQLELLNHLLLKLIDKPEFELSQIFFTTHSPLLCYRSDFQIHYVQIDGNGETKAKKIGAARKEIASFYPDELRKVLEEQKPPQVA